MSVLGKIAGGIADFMTAIIWPEEWEWQRKRRGSRDGRQWRAGDNTTHTVNSTLDPNVAEGGYYHTQVDGDGNKSTAVYDADGSMADVKANRPWEDTPRQD